MLCVSYALRRQIRLHNAILSLSCRYLADYEESMILVVGGIKRGSGKTTVATNLAIIRATEERDVLLIDADTRRSRATSPCSATSARRGRLFIPASVTLDGPVPPVRRGRGIRQDFPRPVLHQ